MMTEEFSGGCLCGGVRYSISTAPQMVGNCYCIDCRKSSGTGHATHAFFDASGLSVHGAVKFYDRAADSGNIVSRGFCANCGCAVYSTNSAFPGMIFVRASSLDNPDLVKPQMAVYTSRAPAWDKLDPDLPSFAEMPEGGPSAVLEG